MESPQSSLTPSPISHAPQFDRCPLKRSHGQGVDKENAVARGQRQRNSETQLKTLCLILGMPANLLPRCEEEGETGRKNQIGNCLPDLEGRARRGVGQNDIAACRVGAVRKGLVGQKPLDVAGCVARNVVAREENVSGSLWIGRTGNACSMPEAKPTRSPNRGPAATPGEAEGADGSPEAIGAFLESWRLVGRCLHSGSLVDPQGHCRQSRKNSEPMPAVATNRTGFLPRADRHGLGKHQVKVAAQIRRCPSSWMMCYRRKAIPVVGVR